MIRKKSLFSQASLSVNCKFDKTQRIFGQKFVMKAYGI